MSTTLATFTKTIDNAFTETWYDIKPEATDNILLATVVWAVLMKNGCFDTQVGGNSIERTIKYAVGPSATPVVKGDILGQGEFQTETAAFWTWRYVASSIQRSVFDDQQNNGKYRIKDYVKKRTLEAKEALEQNYETSLLQAEVTDESGKAIQGLNDIVPSFNNRATGTYGGINRSNPWWVPNYLALTLPVEVNLLANMKTLYNNIFKNQSPPDLLLTDQGTFETYEEFALDQVQIIKDESTYLADLGFEVLRFKGKPLIWTPNMATSNVLMLNTDFIEVIYDPELWFDMTEWKAIPLQGDRIAHILCTMNVISSQLLRHGRLYLNARDG